MINRYPLLKRELLVADASLPDLDKLLIQCSPRTETRLVESGINLLITLKEALKAGYESIHLIGHGSPGSILFGDNSLTLGDFEALAGDGGMSAPAWHFWSCMTGSGEKGRRFVDGIAKLFNSAVTAFSGLVGDEKQGGSWMPDILSGCGAVAAPFIGTPAYSHVLAKLIGTNINGNKLNLRYDTTIDPSSLPANASTFFTVSSPGLTLSVTGVAVDATNGNLLRLVLSSPIAPDTVVKVSYNGSAGIDDVNSSVLTAFNLASFTHSSRYSGTLFDTNSDGAFDLLSFSKFWVNSDGNVQVNSGEDLYRIVDGVDSGSSSDFVAQRKVVFSFGADTNSDGRPDSLVDGEGSYPVTWLAAPGADGHIAESSMTVYMSDPANPNGPDIAVDTIIYLYDDHPGDGKPADRMVFYTHDDLNQPVDVFARVEIASVDLTSMTCYVTYGPSLDKDIFDFTLAGGVVTPSVITLPSDSFDSDTTAPDFMKTVWSSGSTFVSLVYLELLDTFHAPSASDFAVMVNGTPVTVSSVGISQNKVSLNLASSIPDAATVSISYTDPTAGNDTNAIQDLNGNDASTMNSSSGGGSSDTTPPVLGSASVNGSSLTLTYNENLGPVPSGSAFTVMANGSQINVSGVSVYNGSMTLNLATSVYAGQTVTVSYTDPTTGNDANAIQDAAGNDASGFSGYVVTNNTSNTQFYLFHYTTGPVVAWAGSSWFHIDIMEDGDGNSRTWNANLVTIDQQNGNTRTESGTVLLLDTNNDGVLDHWGAWMTKSDTVPLMGDANHDGQPDGLFTDGAVEVPFVWQARDENGVVATFAFENENGVVSGSLFDLDGNGDPDYARVTENGVTTMQKITFVDTDGNGVDDTIDVLKASFYSGALQVNASNQPTGLWFSGENLANDSNTVAPVLSLDNSSVSIYHHKVACIIDGADADATDAEGDMLVFTLDGAPVDGTGHALFSIDAETGQISLTSAGATFIHDASLSDTFNLTVRVTDGVEAHDQTAALTVSLTNEAASYDCTMNVTYRNSGEGVEGVSAKLTDLSNQATSGADNGNGQYGYTGLTEGNYTLSTMKVATESDSDAITLDDVFETLWLVFDDQNSHTSTWQYLAADVSRDGFVGFRDVVGILKMALHREASPSGWAFVPASTGDEPMSIDNVSWPDATIPVTLDQDKEVDLVGVLLGDVDGSWGG